MKKPKLIINFQKWPFELAIMVFFCLIVHALVLIFVYPGYYAPFWPHHSDFYLAPALAQSSIGYLDYFSMARPISMLFLEITGHLGARGAIAVNLLLVCLNCVLTGIVLRRLTAMTFNRIFLASFVLYLLLVFSHPLQYVWATYDCFTQLSYFLLMVAVLVVMRGSNLFFVFALFLCAFLAKETFGLSALFLVIPWFVLCGPTQRFKVMRVGAMVFLALVAALIINRINRSPFLGTNAGPGTPYYMDFSLESLTSEWMLYAKQGFGWGILLVLAGTAVLLVFNRRSTKSIMMILSIVLPIAGGLAWLPNSAIPNHHFPGYSWNGSYLVFAPVMFLSVLWSSPYWHRLGFVVLIGLVLANLIPGSNKYAGSGWIVEQQDRQRRLLQDLDKTLKQINAGAKSILITGLDFPFSPFDHGLSLFSMANIGKTHFDVVTYVVRDDRFPASALLAKQITPVKFVTPAQAQQRQYDEIWMFRNDGSMIRTLNSKNDPAPMAVMGFTSSQLLVFPAVADALGVFPGKDMSATYIRDGYRLLNCGAALGSYNEPQLALTCLRASSELIPGNSYPYFYSGLMLERLGRTDQAKPYFEKAVAFDDLKHPNPGFREALKRYQ